MRITASVHSLFRERGAGWLCFRAEIKRYVRFTSSRGGRRLFWRLGDERVDQVSWIQWLLEPAVDHRICGSETVFFRGRAADRENLHSIEGRVLANLADRRGAVATGHSHS